MNHYHFPIICLILSAVGIAAYAQEASTNDWHPNTKLLDLGAKLQHPSKNAATTLAHDVKMFYQALRDKHWHETYELRAKAYREDVQESNYLARAIEYEKIWSLVNYEVLSITFQNSDPANENLDTAILICKFTELPDYEVSYSTVFWHNEEGVWKCLSAGPQKLNIFIGTRPPTIDWR